MKIIYFLCSLLFCMNVQAQYPAGAQRQPPDRTGHPTTAITPVGDYVDHVLNNGVLEISAANGKLQLLPFRPETVRITFIPSGTSYSDTSYSVVLDPVSLSPGVVENPDYLIFSTGELQLVIHKYPVQVSFVQGTDTIAREDVGSYALSGGQGVRFALEPGIYPVEVWL